MNLARRSFHPPTIERVRWRSGPRRGLGGLAAAGALIAATAACGSDGGLGGLTGPADVSPTDASAPSDDPGGGGPDDLDDLADLIDPDDLADLLGEGDGSGVLVIDGESIPVNSVSCGRIPGGEQVRMEANIDPGFSYFQVRFSEDWNDPDGGYDFDRVSSADLWLDQTEFALDYRAFGDAVVGWGDEFHATGTAILTPSGDRARDAGPEVQFVEFTILCEPGHPVRPMPDGVEPLRPPSDEPDPSDEQAEPDELFDPEAGWADELGAVEVPAAPGVGLVTIGGEQVELFVECGGGPRASDPVEGVAFELDIAAVDIVGGSIGFEIRRTIGSFSGATRFAEDEYVYVFRDAGVGALGWMVTSDGETVEPRNWPLAPASFVRIDRDGAFTVEVTVDHPLQGEFEATTFALGGRCQDGWQD